MVGSFISSGQKAKDGKPPRVFLLTNERGTEVVVMDIGASWLSCAVELKNGTKRQVCLGTADFTDFLKQSCYFGATVGRFANRIEKGRFSIDGKVYEVKTNQFGNCLHGGPEGFDKRRWDVVKETANQIIFQLVSPDMDQGFPGTVTTTVTYELKADNELKIDFYATTDKPTIVNLTNHAYFHLDGADEGNTIHNMKMQIDAQQFLPVDSSGIPTSSVLDVEGTSFDFRKVKTIGCDMHKDFQKPSKGYDHGFLLKGTRDLLSPVAQLWSEDSLLRMDVRTNSPALQVYGGNYLSGQPNRVGGAYNDHSGVALEIGFLADTPNHPDFHSSDTCIVRPDRPYKYFAAYKFTAL